MKINIPFREQFREAMVNDQKTMTCRSKRYGDPDDHFEIFDNCFRLLAVYKQQLGYIAYHSFKAEGCSSQEEFINIWNELHPRKKFHPNTWVYVHVFAREK